MGTHRVTPKVTYTRVTAQNTGTRVVITHTTVRVTTAAVRGPEGPPGQDGQDGQDGAPGAPGPPGSGEAYVHTQDVPSAVWTVVHGFGRPPAGITVIDSSGRVGEGDPYVVDSNTLRLEFRSAFAGKAILS